MNLVPYNITALAEDDAVGSGKNIVAGASVNITKIGGGSAQIYTDATGSTLITLPTVTDADGELLFYISPDDYIFTIDGKNYNISIGASRQVDTWAAIATTDVSYAGQLFPLAQHTSGGIGGGALISKVGSVADNGGTKKNSATPGFYLERINYLPAKPSMFGCMFDGVTIDTDNFKKCIAACLDIQLDEGTYLLAATATSGDFLLYLGTQGAGGNPVSRDGLRIRGNGAKSIIKLANAVGRNPLVFGGANGDTLQNMIFEDFVIDLNGQNNLQTSFADPYRYNNAFYFFCQCYDITFRNLRIKNLSTAQGIRIGSGSSGGFGRNIRLLNCNIETFGIALTGNFQQDVSAVYINADKIEVDGCGFTNPDFTFDLVRGQTALELHGDTSTIVTNCNFNYIQMPILVGNDYKATRNFIVNGNTFYQCNYLVNLNTGGFDQKQIEVTKNSYFSTKVLSVICPIGASGESNKNRENIIFSGNSILTWGNSSQAIPLFYIPNSYLRSILIENNDIGGLNGSLIYFTGTVMNSGNVDVTIKNNRLDSLGATSGAFPNTPTFIHIDTSSGTINSLTIDGNQLFNSSAKNYSALGCYKISGAISYCNITDTASTVSQSYPVTIDGITGSVYKNIESSYEKPIDYRTGVVAVAATSSVNIFDFSSFTLTDHAMFDIKLWIGVGGTSNNSVFHYSVAANSAAKTATLLLSNGTYSANITINFTGNILRVTSTSGSALSMYASMKGYTTLPIAWLI